MSTDIDELLNYSAMRLILVFNEQFMMQRATSSMDGEQESQNQILRVLKSKIGSSKTFSENLIFMLNRAGKQVGLVVADNHQNVYIYVLSTFRRCLCTNVDFKVVVLDIYNRRTVRVLLHQ